MPIVYAQFSISFHGLQATSAQLESLRQALLESARQVHPDYPHLRFADDVEVELLEHAGHDTEAT